MNDMLDSVSVAPCVLFLMTGYLGQTEVWFYVFEEFGINKGHIGWYMTSKHESVHYDFSDQSLVILWGYYGEN